MSLNKQLNLIVVLICLLSGVIQPIQSQEKSDSLISPRYYNISYLSKKLPTIKKYYLNVIKKSKEKNNYSDEILATIYLSKTYRYEYKHDSSNLYLNISNELINKHEPVDDFLKYQYYKANAANQFFKYNYDSLLNYTNNAIKIASNLNFDSVEIADLMFLKFTAYNVIYKYDSALFYLVNSLSTLPKAYKEIKLYSVLGRLCALYKDNGYLKKAEKALFDALKNSNPNIPIQKSTAYFCLGEHYLDISDYEKSIQYFKLKLNYDSISSITNFHEQSIALAGIGRAYRYQRKYINAIHYYNKAKESIPDRASDQLIDLYEEIGISYSVNKNLILAKSHFIKALNMAINGKGITELTLAFAYIRLGDFEVKYHNDKNGIQHLDSGVRIINRCYGDKSRLLMFPYNNLSDAYKIIYKDYESSMNYIQKSLQLNMPDLIISNYEQKLDPKSSVHLYELLTILSRKITLLNKWLSQENSQSLTKMLITALHNTIITYSNTEELNRARIKNIESKYTRTSMHKKSFTKAMVGLRLLFNKTNNIEYLHLLYEYSAKNKAISLQESLEESNAKLNLIPKTLIDVESEHNRKIGFLNDIINQENQKQKPNKSQLEIWKEDLQKEIILKDLLIHKIEIDYPDYYTLKHDKHTLTVEEIQQKLKQNQVLIEYSLYKKNSLFIFGISKNEFKSIEIDADSLLFYKLESVINSLKVDGIHKFNKQEFDNFRSVSHYLYSSLIKPFSELIKSKEVIINPDEELWYLPFDILLTDTISTSLSYKDLSYLIKENPINYTYSTRLLLNPKNKKQKTPFNILAMAPTYKMSKSSPNLHKDQTVRKNKYFSPLPSSVEEAEHIHKLFGGKLLIGEQATERVFKETADEYSILHLAMHAIIDNENPQFSKLVFNQSYDSIEDNFLNTYEIYNKPLRAQMAVLSSCNSGSGKIKKGEGIISIARAFLYAGCPSLVMTLWSVNDKASSTLMQYYYDYLKQGSNKSTALQQSKIKFLNSVSPLYQHPHFWASYTVIGVNDPIEHKRSRSIYFILIGVLLLIVLFSKRIRKLIKVIKY